MDKKYCHYCMEPYEGDLKICNNCGNNPISEGLKLYHIKPGMVLHNRYMVGMSIGEGGFGITYIGRDLLLDIPVAIKEYYPVSAVARKGDNSFEVVSFSNEEGNAFQKYKAKFLDEAKTLAQFSTTNNIVSVKDFFEENNTAYIVMEYLHGISLNDKIAEHGLYSFSEAFALLKPLLVSIGKIHEKNLIHRDISPTNIMCMPDGSVKLLDFGAARKYSSDSEQSLSVIVKPGYAPEEQYNSKGIQGPATDEYAIVATMYKMITGKVPENALNRIFEDTLATPSSLGAKITPREEAAMMKALSVRSKDRFPTIAAFIEAVEAGDSEKTSMEASVIDSEVTMFVSDNKPVNVSQQVKYNEPAVESQPVIQNKPVVENRPDNNIAVGSVDEKTEYLDENQRGFVSANIDSEKPAKRKKSKKNIKKIIGIIAGIAAVIFITVRVLSPSSKDIRQVGANAFIEDTHVTSKMISSIANKTESVTFKNCTIDDAAMTKLKKLSKVRYLIFNNCSGFSSFAPIADVPSLSFLEVRNDSMPWIQEGGYDVAIGSMPDSIFAEFDGNSMFPGTYSNVKTVFFELLNFQNGTDFLSNFTNLSSISFDKCRGIDSFDSLKNCSGFKYLNLYSIDSGSIDFSGLSECKKFEGFLANDSNITDISWMESLDSIAKIEIDQGNIKNLSAIKNLSLLSSLSMTNCGIEDISDIPELSRIYSIDFLNNNISDISALKNASSASSVNLTNNKISDISVLSDFTKLTSLDLNDNQIEDISPLAYCNNVVTMHISNNELTDLNGCSNMVSLKYMYASNNKIGDISGLANSSQLEVLYLGGNNISDISPLANASGSITTLVLSSNEISDISALKDATELKALAIDYNNISSIDALEKSTKLQGLLANNNKIEKIDVLGNFPAMIALDLGNNNISDITVLTGLKALKSGLALENNNVSDIMPISVDMSNKDLYIYNNPISDISSFRDVKGVNSLTAFLISWQEGMDYSVFAESGYKGKVTLVDCPVSEQGAVLKACSGSVYKPEFITTDEADQIMKEKRTRIRELSGVASE